MLSHHINGSRKRAKLWVRVLWLCLSLPAILFATDARAADASFVGVLVVAVEDDVARQLGLSDEVKAKLLQVIDRREQEVLDLVLEIKDLPAAERSARLAPFVAESQRQGLLQLDAAQRSRLQQLSLARAGMSGLADSKLGTQLRLSDQQQAQVKNLIAQRDAVITRVSQQQGHIVRAQYERELAAVLSPAQRAAWEQMAGLATAGIQLAQAETPFVPESPPRATDAAAQQKLPPSTPQPSTMTAGGETKLRFNFRYAPWKDVLDWFAQQADLSLIVDAPPPGTFNYTDSRTYTAAEAIDLLNSVLLIKGYTLVRRDRMLMLVNLEDGIPPNLVSQVPLSELDSRGEFELVSALFPVSKMTPDEAQTEVQKLLGPQGSVVALSKAGQIYVIETAGRLRTIRSVIEAIENPSTLRDQKLTVISLQHILPEEVLVVARQLLGLPADQNSAEDGSIRIAADALSGRLLVTGNPEMVQRIQEIVKEMDKPAGAVGAGGSPLEMAQLETYPITRADPATVLQVMQTLLAGQPDARLAIDEKAKRLVALARPSDHRTIAATLKQMEGEQFEFDIIQLRRLDPQSAVLLITKLFGGGTGEQATGPTVDGDPSTMQLLVRGTSEEIEQVRGLITKLEGDTAGAEGLRGNLRFLPVTGRSAQSVLEQAQTFWPTQGSNRIRVVTPSTTNEPSMRGRYRFPSDRPGSSGSATEGNNAPSAAPPQPRSAPVDQLESRKPAAKPEWPEIKTAATPPALQVRFEAVKKLGQAPRGYPKIPGNSQVSSEPVPFFHSLFVNQTNLLAQNDDATTADDSTSNAGAASKTAQIVPPEIVVSVTPDGIILQSEDTAALDEFESLLRTFSGSSTAAAREPVVFWLKYAKADVAAGLLQTLLGGAGGGGSLLGDIATSALGEVGGGILGGLLGAGTSSSSTLQASGTVSIVADPRLNALIVQANPADLVLVEQLLEVIDQESSPEDVQTAGKPRMIPVIYTNAEEIAGVLRQVYANRLATGSSQQRQPSPEEFLQALRGGGGGRDGGRGGSSQARGEEAKMTLGVDQRSNSLIVTAPDPLFQEVQALVSQIDHAGTESNETIQVLTLKRASPELVQKAVTSIVGSSVTTGTTSSSTTGQSSSTSPSASSSESPRSEPNVEDIRRRIEFFRSLQQGGGPGGPTGGPTGGGSSFGSGFGRPDSGSGGGDRGDRGGRGSR